MKSDAERKRDEANPALKLWVVLNRARDAVAELEQSHLSAHGLTPAEFGALEALHHKGPLRLSELQRKILVSSGGITYVVDRLSARGWVERRPCPEDRRASFAALTTSGEAFMDRMFPEHRACLERALEGLSRTEQRSATGLLRTLGRAAAESSGCQGG